MSARSMQARGTHALRGVALALACALALAACGEVEPVAVERVQAGPVTLLLRAEGELASLEPAVLRVQRVESRRHVPPDTFLPDSIHPEHGSPIRMDDGSSAFMYGVDDG